MKIYSKNDMCVGCGTCADKCPVNAISMKMDKEGFYYPFVSNRTCIHCHQCLNLCPTKDKSNIINENRYFGAKALNNDTRYSSSSGGFFPILAEYVLDKQGVVYGAGLDENLQVKHFEIENIDQISKLQKTKYVQSDLTGIYKKVKNRLNEHRYVLFCGTPCQCQGLRNYLGKDSDYLIFVDLICYGVPSPGIWNSYKKYIENIYDGVLEDFSFRDKRNHDNGHTVSWIINDHEYTQPLNKNLYNRLYFGNLIIRPSCYQCRFTSVRRNSDLTIGDFWGIEKIYPEFDDGMGCSVVITHSAKGLSIWNNVKDSFQYFECSENDVLQPRLKTPTKKPHIKRLLFMICYGLMSFKTCIKIMYRGEDNV
ncbi:MAG: Coenzyme F420 hydrogenase/dehydrogenase, beta subunit C-terminal domain [Erysipelotrichaceae bacterium]|nr:Coenzyme F420 hydrogenase/dehydrogenase, beta subunit C-terminal domain [Erysipelotrichaceae bacterium]